MISYQCPTSSPQKVNCRENMRANCLIHLQLSATFETNFKPRKIYFSLSFHKEKHCNPMNHLYIHICYTNYSSLDNVINIAIIVSFSCVCVCRIHDKMEYPELDVD